MNCKSAVAYVCLSMFVANVKPNPGGETLHRKRSTDSCGTCDLRRAIDESALSSFKAELKNLGPVVGKVESNLAAIFNTQFPSVDALKAAIGKNLLDAKAAADNLLDKLSASLANVTSCPEYRQYMINLKENLGNLLSGFSENWPKYVTAVDRAPLVDSLRRAVPDEIPNVFRALSDIVFYYFQVFEPDNCILFLEILKPTLNPKGQFAKFMAYLFGNVRGAANALLQLLVGVILPGQEGTSLDHMQIVNRVICGVLSIVVYPPELNETTGGLCPDSPADAQRFNMGNAVKMIICEVLVQLGFDKNPWTVGVYLACNK